MNPPVATPVVFVTGAGSGLGRAVALRFAREGWSAALLGRRHESLEETARLAGTPCMILPCDVGDAVAVEQAVTAVRQRFGRIDAVVNSAGINVPRRSWEEISPVDFERILTVNVRGAFHCIRAALPALRERRGTVVNINSEAGRRATAVAGVAYVAAKHALAGLTGSLSAEQRRHGVRAVSLFPGAVNTTLLDQRPQPPPAAERRRLVQPEDVAECAWLAVSLPAHTLLEQLVIRPTAADPL